MGAEVSYLNDMINVAQSDCKCDSYLMSTDP